MRLPIEIADSEFREINSDSLAIVCDSELPDDSVLPDFASRHVLFDIETQPLPPEILKDIVKPYEHKGKPHPGDFDPESVRYGNTKDAAKRAIKLADAEKKHARTILEWEKSEQDGEIEYWETVYEQCTLKASRSTVCTIQIGTQIRSELPLILCGDERWMIETFFETMATAFNGGRAVIGFNVFQFDFPYLFRRAWLLGIPIPDFMQSGPLYAVRSFTDISDVWRCGQPSASGRIPLAELGQALRLSFPELKQLGTKNDLGASGKLFHHYWNEPALRAQAIEYAANDISELREVANCILPWFTALD